MAQGRQDEGLRCAGPVHTQAGAGPSVCLRDLLLGHIGRGVDLAQSGAPAGRGSAQGTPRGEAAAVGPGVLLRGVSGLPARDRGALRRPPEGGQPAGAAD